MVQAAIVFLLQCLSTADSFALQSDTEVKVVYAYHTSSDANAGLPKHSNTGILDGKHNLILMAISAMQPSSTVMPPTSTAMPPTSPKDSVSSGVIGPYVSFYIVLACLSVYFMCF